MPLYYCDICNYSSKIKSNYIRHLNTSKHFEKVYYSKEYGVKIKKNIDGQFFPYKMTRNDHDLTTDDHKKSVNDHKMTTNYAQNRPYSNKSLRCHYCSQEFSTTAHKKRHENYWCKHKNAFFCSNEKEYSQIMNRHDKEKEILYKQIEMLINRTGNTTINNLNNSTTNTSNTTNLTTNNIKINKFGKEDTSYITKEMLNKMLKKPNVMIPIVIKKIYFHSKHPENRTIRITNKNGKFIHIYNGQRWIVKSKKRTVRRLVDDNYDRMDIHYDEGGKESLTANEIFRFINFQERYDNGEVVLLSELDDSVEILIINNSK